MTNRICLIGLDEPQNAWFRSRLSQPFVAYESLPRILVRDGRLFMEELSGYGQLQVAKVVLHGIFEHDHDVIAGFVNLANQRPAFFRLHPRRTSRERLTYS